MTLRKIEFVGWLLSALFVGRATVYLQDIVWPPAGVITSVACCDERGCNREDVK